MAQPKIFISYRRDDSRVMAHRIHDTLRDFFGKDDVFIDVDDIPAGVDFRDYLHEEIRQADIVLVLIANRWADIMRKRLRDNNDFVRIELLAALEMRKLVIPILIGNATMPDTRSLPPEIRDTFPFLNAIKIDDTSNFGRDMQRLIPQLEQWENIPISSHSISDNGRQKTTSRYNTWLIGFVSVLLLGILLLFLWQSGFFDSTTSTETPTAETTATETIEVSPTAETPTATPTIVLTPNGGGARFVFARGTANENEGDEIVVFDLNHSPNDMTLTFDDYDNGNPVWSPDGNQIAYQSFRRSAWVIVIMAADGTSNIQRTSTNQNRVQPAWSPDGTRLAFAIGQLGQREIAILDLASNQERIITDSAWDAFSPVWIDDNNIAFISDNPGNNHINYVALPTGLTSEGVSLGGNATQMSISADGSTLVYALDIATADDDIEHDIYVLSLSEEEAIPQNITNNTNIIHNYPAWSPDGTQIVYMTDVDGNNEIYTMNADGSNRQQLTNTSLWEWNPQWAAD